MIVVSYVPLLYGTAAGPTSARGNGQFDPRSTVEKAVASMPTGAASGCTWVLNSGSVSPVLVMKDAQKLKHHLEWWAEGRPEAWFDLQIAELEGSFAVAVVPRVQKSVDREFLRAALRDGSSAKTMTGYSVIYRALHFVSDASSTSYDQVRRLIHRQNSVGLLDSAELEGGFPRMDRIQWIRDLNVVSGKEAQYAAELLSRGRSWRLD